MTTATTVDIILLLPHLSYNLKCKKLELFVYHSLVHQVLLKSIEDRIQDKRSSMI